MGGLLVCRRRVVNFLGLGSCFRATAWCICIYDVYAYMHVGSVFVSLIKADRIAHQTQLHAPTKRTHTLRFVHAAFKSQSLSDRILYDSTHAWSCTFSLVLSTQIMSNVSGIRPRAPVMCRVRGWVQYFLYKHGITCIFTYSDHVCLRCAESECNISYVDTELGTKKRIEKLMWSYGFRCKCPRCSGFRGPLSVGTAPSPWTLWHLLCEFNHRIELTKEFL
jgi:hypothetical protein